MLAQRSFASGEVSPAFWGRTDMVKYAQGLRTLRNYYVMKFGGAQSRSGTKLINYQKENGYAPRLIDFEFNDEQTYILEFGEKYIRFYRNDIPIFKDFGDIEQVDGDGGSSPLEVKITAHAFVDTDMVFIYGLDHIIPRGMYEVDNATTDTFELIDRDGNPVVWGGGVYEPIANEAFVGTIFQLTTVYEHEHLMDIRFIQSADVIILTHQLYPVQKLVRTGPTDSDWNISSASYGPSIAAPSGFTVTGGSSGLTSSWAVTAVNAFGEESLPAYFTISASVGTFTLDWNVVPGATLYRIYVGAGDWTNSSDGPFFLATGTSNGPIAVTFTSAGPETYLEAGIWPSSYVNTPFGSTGNYPKCCGIYQQRLGLGNTINNPERVWFSKPGSLFNFNFSIPTVENDTISFSLAGKQVNSVEHLLDLAVLLLFTRTGEHTANAPALTPFDIELRQESYNGSSDLRPVVIDGTAVYVQNRGTIIRDVGWQFESDGYRGNDLTIFSSHLVDGHTIIDWDFAKTPDSIVWCVRDDGVLLSLTYIKEQQILGWAHHDLDGDRFFERVCCIPQGSADALYCVVRNGADTQSIDTYRTIEKFTRRFIDGSHESLTNFIGMDAAVTIDGRNITPDEIRITGGTNWDESELLTLTMNLSFGHAGFLSTEEIGNQFHFTANDGTIVKLLVESVTSNFVVSARPDRTVPPELRSQSITNWSRAIKTVKGLWHLEGKKVSILGDAFVVGSPNNPDYPEYTVTGGEVTLDACYSVISIGLPFVCDFETLDIDFSGSRSIANKNKRVASVTLQLEKTKGLWVGPKSPGNDSLDGLMELKVRQYEDYEDPVKLVTGKESVIIQPEWNSSGHVFVRQVDPLPATILAVFPDGDYPLGGA